MVAGTHVTSPVSLNGFAIIRHTPARNTATPITAKIPGEMRIKESEYCCSSLVKPTPQGFSKDGPSLPVTVDPEQSGSCGLDSLSDEAILSDGVYHQGCASGRSAQGGPYAGQSSQSRWRHQGG